MTQQLPSNLPSRIKRLRADLGLSQSKLAALLGVSFASVHRWEHGRTQPSAVAWQRIAQAEIGGIAAQDVEVREQPASRLAPHWQSNLPLAFANFVGRRKELAEIVELLCSHRLVTLTGAGGCGKTRLALELAGGLAANARLSTRFPNGVLWVDLAALSDPTLVPQALATALGLREQPGLSLHESCLSFLEPREMLVVFDNCEHLVGAAATLAVSLLGSCRSLSILATSREGLRVTGEKVLQVAPLSLPTSDQPTAATTFATSEAVQLFVERVRLCQPGFELIDQNAEAVAGICRRLDGIPLALELAAVQLGALSAEQLVTRLDDRFRLLLSGSRTALPRHQTLRATLDWSYNLLSGPEQGLFQRLAVFAGGFTLDAAEHVCAEGSIGREAVLDLLSRLVAKSLVQFDLRDTPRYRLLETVRAYAAERLQEGSDDSLVRRRHLDYVLALAAPPPLWGLEEGDWLARLRPEDNNLREALQSTIEQRDGESLLLLAGSLWRYYEVEGRLSEGRAWLGRALNDGLGSPAARADALFGAGVLAHGQGDNDAARECLEACIALRSELGDRRGIAIASNLLGMAFYSQSDYATARACYAESLAIWRDLGEKQFIAAVLNNLGSVARAIGEYEAAEASNTEALALQREIGQEYGIAWSLNNLGMLASDSGDFERARALHEESLAIRRGLGEQRSIAISLDNLGLSHYRQGDIVEARAYFVESLKIQRDLGDRFGAALSLGHLGLVEQAEANLTTAERQLRASLVIWRDLKNKPGALDCLWNFAVAAEQRGLNTRALRLCAAVIHLRDRLGLPAPPLDGPTQKRLLDRLRASLSKQQFASAWEAGEAMPLEEAIGFAFQEEPAGTVEPEAELRPGSTAAQAQMPAGTLSTGGDVLTRRESEVLRLIAAGSSNREIAEALVISVRTVEHHITNIYTKIGARGKADATAYALHHDLN